MEDKYKSYYEMRKGKARLFSYLSWVKYCDFNKICGIYDMIINRDGSVDYQDVNYNNIDVEI